MSDEKLRNSDLVEMGVDEYAPQPVQKRKRRTPEEMEAARAEEQEEVVGEPVPEEKEEK